MTLLISCWAIQMAQAASLLNGRYETTTDVTDYLNLAYDASNMIESDDHELILDIYKNVSSTSLSPSVPRISVVAVILFWVSSMKKKKTFYGMSRNRITSLEQNLHVVFFCFVFLVFFLRFSRRCYFKIRLSLYRAHNEPRPTRLHCKACPSPPRTK
jgi:hypothetical protein